VPKKPKLGQNFLVDDQARHRIAEALGDVTARTVVEIGPGHGAITELLAARAGRLVAIELDRSLAAELKFRFRDQPHVTILEADVLTADFSQFAQTGVAFDVVGNLPYYITSDILLHLFAAARQGLVERAVLMMQREVAERVTAAPGVRDYGLLSATTQMHGSADLLFTLPPEAFHPPPDVFSSIVRMQFAPRFAELAVDPAGFDRLLHQVFAQKRKTLRNNLRAAEYSSGAIDAAWPEDLAAQVRAEQVPLEAMAAMYRGLRSEKALAEFSPIID
jgi:16S rRNA (adenine1518-N6/adenine1519-N6)-dimethyltransferase